ncbi:MAG: histidine kinase [Lachnospiraceae bacterium]|nr:histidine kinase [Lachnospiraceae bacterium]
MFSYTVKNTSNKLQNHLVMLIVGITFGIGIIFSAVFTSLYRGYLENSLAAATGTNMKFLTDSIDHNLDSVNQLIRWSQVNTTISNYVEVKNNQRYGILSVNAQERLTEELQNNPAFDMIHRVVIGNANGRFIQYVPATYSTTINLGAAIPELPYFDALIADSSKQFSTGLITDPFYPASDKTVFPVIRPIYAKFRSNNVGWIFIELTENIFTEPLQYYSHAADSGIYLILGEHTYDLSDGSMTESDFTYTINRNLSTAATDEQSYIYYVTTFPENQESILIKRCLSQDGCYLIQTLSQQELKKQNQMLVSIWIVILVIMFIIAVSLSYLLHFIIGIPIRKMRFQLSQISDGNFASNKEIEWNNELGDIGRGINSLAGNIEHLIEKRIADEKEKKDLEYKMLQNQINPHFLYNTLNSIKWMASIQGATGIADMTTSLSRLLKSISKGTKLLIPLSEEIALVTDYFNIQNYRYGGTILFEVCCDDETLLDTPIIKFTLQPIVENAIFHGLEPKGGSGTIRITVQPQNDASVRNIEIIVWDNGVGMTPEKIENLLTSNDGSTAEFFREVGVSNVHKRLQYEFGDAYGIHIESVLGEYTEMHIAIPAL